MTHQGARLAISSIAWLKEETDLVFDVIAGSGVTGIEVAPGTMSPSYAAGVRQDGVFSAYARRLTDHGLQSAAVQDVLCGGGPYAFWGDDDAVARTVEKVSMAAGAATALQTRTIVLGAPSLRGRRCDTDGGDMNGFARFARRALRMTEHRGVSIAFEPCSSIYGCEFAKSHEAARRVAHAVMSVGHGAQKALGAGLPARKKASHGVAAPGMDEVRAGVFGITFDLATALLEEDDVERCVMEYAPKALHLHISEPHLVRVGSCGAEHHKAAARALMALRADGSTLPPWISIEMNRPQLSSDQVVENIRRAVDFVTETYSGAFDF